MNRKVWIIAGLALLATLLIVTGCSYLDTTGESRANIRPEVFIANVPLASTNLADTTFDSDSLVVSIDTLFDSVVSTSTYLANPRIHWYGTDEDGRVDAYEYAVIPTDSLSPHPVGLPIVRNAAGNVDPRRFADTLVDSFAAKLDWIEVLAPNATVGLYADIDTTVAIDQFLFVRAIDNMGLRSHIKYARYSRQNHPPQSYINLDTIEVIQRPLGQGDTTRPRKYFSLPQSTATYPGITIGWSGSDSTDYPDEQPPFDYNWVLYGPFDTRDLAAPDSSRIRRTNDDTTTARLEWTDQDRHTFFNLRSGWYLFEVRSRDDAFVPDPTPARARFQVVEPSFEKPFMLMDATNYYNASKLNAGCVNFAQRTPDSLPVLTPDTIANYYYSLFVDQGPAFSKADTWKRIISPLVPSFVNILPDRDVLARYKALIIYDEDLHLPLDEDNNTGEFYSVLSDYMNVGGRVVLIGRNLFAASVTGWQSNAPEPQDAEFNTGFPLNYFGVTRMYFPAHHQLAQELKKVVADFVSVIPLDPDYPVVVTDTSTLWPIQVDAFGDTTYVKGTPNILSYLGVFIEGVPRWQYIPDVNWIGINRNLGATGFYQFNSSNPNTSPSQGRICGARYEFFDPVLGRRTYRTAVLTFPFWEMKHDANMRRLANQILTYILE